MLKIILNTFLFKILTTIFLFVLVLLTTNYLGAEGRGVISLITASVGIINLVNGFVGGAALVYLWPQNKNISYYKKILFVSIIWAFFSAFITSIILLLFNSFSYNHLIYVLILSISSSMTFSISMLLVGDGSVQKYNSLSLLQSFLNILFFSFSLFILNERTIQAYLISTVLSNIVTLILGIIFINKMRPNESIETEITFKTILSHILKYGFVNQLGNLIQFFNYRLSFFILNLYIGKAIVGKYSVGVQLAESIWLISSSIALVQYSKIANSRNNKEDLYLTLQLAKFSVIITCVCVLIMILIPSSMLTMIFGKDFTEIKNVIYILSPGIILYSFSVIIAHYFAGKGLYYINTIGAAFSLIITLGGNLIFVKNFSYIGAGLTSTVTYSFLTLYYFIIFRKKSNFSFKDFIINKNDIIFIKSKLKFDV